jgi:broad specificity phosphatase PhoE
MSELGKKQAENLALALKGEKLNAIYSSPLQRALETSRMIARYHNLEVQIEPELREFEVGALEGVLASTLCNNFGQFLVECNNGDCTKKMPGGESLSDLQQRSWMTVQRIVSRHAGTVALVSHYFVTLSIICAALGLPPDAITRFRVNVGSMSRLDFHNGYPCLTALGDTCHLL